MKKAIIFLSLIFLIACTTGAVTAFADNEVKTEIFAPHTYLEFFDLNSPIDYCYDAVTDTHVIAETSTKDDSSQNTSRVIVYMDGLYTVHNEDMAGYNISQIKFCGSDYLLFLSDLYLYSIKINGWVVTKTEFTASCFDVKDNTIVMSTGNSFVVLEANVSDGVLTLSKKSYYTLEASYSAIAIIDSNTWLCISESTLKKFTANGNGSFIRICENLPNPRFACYNDGIYYCTLLTGVFAVDINTREVKLLKGKTNTVALKNIVSPQGITFYGGKLYICDSVINAVSEFDPFVDFDFTDFAITSRYDGDGRVSLACADIQTYDNEVYALDGDTVKIFDDKGHKTPRKIPIATNFSSFSVIGNKILASNGNGLYAIETIDGETKLSTISANISGFTSITAITSFAENFYFLNNAMIDSKYYAEVWMLSSENYGKIEKVASIQGIGKDICTDIFGKLYIQINKNSVSSIYGMNIGDTTAPEIFAIPNDKEDGAILSIACDFECNLYALIDNNKIIRIADNGSSKEYTITMSANLMTKGQTAKDIAIVPATDCMYALFNGFLLKLNPADLSIANPAEIKVPESFSTALNKNIVTCTLNSNTRYFEIDLLNTQGENFMYTGYATYDNNDTFVVLHSDDRYTVVTNDKLSCIVRTSDIEKSNLNYAETNKNMFAVSDCYLYTYPVLTTYFRLDTVSENEKLTAVYETYFNGTAFTFVRSVDGTKEGYVPSSMLKTNIAIDDNPTAYFTKTVGRKGADVYSDKELTEKIGRLDAFSTAKVYTDGDICLIDYEGKTAYIRGETLQSKGSVVIRNLILVTLALISVIVSVAFIYKKIYKK